MTNSCVNDTLVLNKLCVLNYPVNVNPVLNQSGTKVCFTMNVIESSLCGYMMNLSRIHNKVVAIIFIDSVNVEKPDHWKKTEMDDGQGNFYLLFSITYNYYLLSIRIRSMDKNNRNFFFMAR